LKYSGIAWRWSLHGWHLPLICLESFYLLLNINALTSGILGTMANATNSVETTDNPNIPT
jgi:hypothetical protein